MASTIAGVASAILNGAHIVDDVLRTVKPVSQLNTIAHRFGFFKHFPKEATQLARLAINTAKDFGYGRRGGVTQASLEAKVARIVGSGRRASGRRGGARKVGRPKVLRT